jgi:hypothetical protein
MNHNDGVVDRRTGMGVLWRGVAWSSSSRLPRNCSLMASQTYRAGLPHVWMVSWRSPLMVSSSYNRTTMSIRR